jgi:hypothetical protein
MPHVRGGQGVQQLLGLRGGPDVFERRLRRTSPVSVRLGHVQQFERLLFDRWLRDESHE